MKLTPLYGYDDYVADWTAKLIPHCRRGFGKSRAFGILDENGWMIAGVVYHNYDPDAGTVEISGASISPQWLQRNSIGWIYQPPFRLWGCQMVFQRVLASNLRIQRILASYGYQLVHHRRIFGRDQDGVIASLTVEDWVANKFNQRFQHHVADMTPVQLELKEAA